MADPFVTESLNDDTASGNVWSLLLTERRLAQELAASYGLHGMVADVLAQRLGGACRESSGDFFLSASPAASLSASPSALWATSDVEHFLKPRIRDLLPDPLLLRDMERAISRTIAALEARETLWIFADYDVDGATSGASLVCFLRALVVSVTADEEAGNASPFPEPRFFVPDRIRDGYGPSPALMQQLKREGARFMDLNEYISWQRDFARLAFEKLKKDGAMFYNHKWRVQGGQLERTAEDILRGLPLRQIIIWDRAGGYNFNQNYFLPTFELLYLIAKKDFRLAPKAPRMKDVWRIPPERNSHHPAPFPLALAERCITSTDAKLVLDPFIGSGTTAVAAINSNRDFIGIDRSEKYCKMAHERIERHKKKQLLI